MRHDFQRDYATLELSADADWEVAQLSYRRLVQRWHPDRNRARVRERVYAQQRFIAITQAFNRLRTYYRACHRLPLEPIGAPDHTDATADQVAQTAHDSRQQGPQASGRTPPAGLWGDRSASASAAAIDELSLLQPKPRLPVRARIRWHGLARTALVTVPIAALLVGTLGFLFVLDRKTAQKNAETAREALKEQPAAEQPSARERQAQRNRGAFVENPVPDKLGDRLMQDLFR